MALLLLAAAHLVNWLWSVTDYKLDQKANQAVFNLYGNRFAALWHPHDEPTGGLRATMLPPYPITYRRPSRGRLQLLHRLFNGTVSRVADDSVWQLVMRKLQGSDRRARLLRRVERTPPCFPVSNLLPYASSLAIVQLVNLQTTSTAANLRSRLASLASYRSSIRAVRSLGKEIMWREVVHNCYYRDANVVEAIGAHISGVGVPQINPIQDNHESDIAQPPFESHSIPVAAAIVTVALAMVLTFPARLVYSAVIYPLTNEAQVGIIAEAIKEPEISSADYRQTGNGEGLSDAILLLTEAGDTTATAEMWPMLSSPSTRSVVAERLAHDFGFRGMDKDLAQLLALLKEKAPENKPLLSSVYANAFLGSLASNRDPSNDILEFVAKNNRAIGCQKNYLCNLEELAFTVEMAWDSRGYDAGGVILLRSEFTEKRCTLLTSERVYLVRLGINPIAQNCKSPRASFALELASYALKFGRVNLAAEILSSDPNWQDVTVTDGQDIVDNHVIDVMEVLSKLGRHGELIAKGEYLLQKVSTEWPVDVADNDRQRIVVLAVGFLKNGSPDLGEKLLDAVLKGGSDLPPLASAFAPDRLSIKILSLAVRELSQQGYAERAQQALVVLNNQVQKQGETAQNLAYLAEAEWWVGNAPIANAVLKKAFLIEQAQPGACSLLRTDFHTLLEISETDAQAAVKLSLVDCVRKSQMAFRANEQKPSGLLSDVVESWIILGTFRNARLAAEIGRGYVSTITDCYSAILRGWLDLRGVSSPHDSWSAIVRPHLYRVDN